MLYCINESSFCICVFNVDLVILLSFFFKSFLMLKCNIMFGIMFICSVFIFILRVVLCLVFINDVIVFVMN